MMGFYSMATQNQVMLDSLVMGGVGAPGDSLLIEKVKQSNQMWAMLYQIVKENCSTEYQGATPQDSVMERLLRAREGSR